MIIIRETLNIIGLVSTKQNFDRINGSAEIVLRNSLLTARRYSYFIYPSSISSNKDECNIELVNLNKMAY